MMKVMVSRVARLRRVEVLASDSGLHRGRFTHRKRNSGLGACCGRYNRSGFVLPTEPGFTQQRDAHQVLEGEDCNQDQGGTPTVHGTAIVFAQLQSDGSAISRTQAGPAGYLHLRQRDTGRSIVGLKPVEQFPEIPIEARECGGV